MAYYIGEIIKLRDDFARAYKMGNYSKAIETGEKISKMYKDNKDTENLDYANDLNNLAVVYDDIFGTDQAIKIYIEVAALKKELLGENSLSYADTLNNLAIDYSLRSRFNEALRMHRKVLEIREANLDKLNVDCIFSLYNIGNAYDDLKKYDLAIEYLSSAKARADKQPEFSKSDYGDIFLSLARTNEKKGNYIMALAYFAKAIEMIRYEKDGKNFRYLMALLAAAKACEKAEKLDMAVIYYSKALDLREKLLEKTHLDYISNLNSLAGVYVKKKEYDKALTAHREALELTRDIMGTNHVFYADGLNNIALDYSYAGDIKEAEKLLFDALSIKKQEIGETHPYYAVTLMNLGNVYFSTGEFKEALEKYMEAESIRKTALGEKSPEYSETLSHIGKVYFALKDYKTAEEYFRRSLKIRGDISKTDISFACDLKRLADCLALEGDKKSSLELNIKALETRKIIFGGSHPEYAAGLYFLAKAQRETGDFENAISNLQIALEIFEENIGRESKIYIMSENELKSTCNEAAKLYYDRKDIKKALEFYERCGKIGQEEKDFELAVDFAVLYTEKGNIKRAGEILDALIHKLENMDKKRTEVYARALLERGKIYLTRGIIGEARAFLEHALIIRRRYFPEDKEKQSDLEMLLAEIYYKEGNSRSALEFFEKNVSSSDLKRAAYAGYRCAQMYFEEGDREKAAVFIKEARKIKEENFSVHDHMYSDMLYLEGIICSGNNEPLAAEEAFCKSLEMEKQFTESKSRPRLDKLIKTGDLLVSLGREEAAVKVYADALNLAKELKEKNIPSLLLKIASLYEKINDYTKAIIYYEEAALTEKAAKGEEKPKYLKIQAKLGGLYFKINEKKKALETYEKLYAVCIAQGKEPLFNKECRINLSAIYKAGRNVNKLMRLKSGKPLV